jgi:hypothetical protein
MGLDLFRDKGDSTNGTKWRFDPMDLRKTIRTKSLLALFHKFFATGALRREKELEEG